MYISIDIGGTNARVAKSELLEPLEFESDTIRFELSHDFEQDFGKLVSFISKDGTISGIGIGIPGDISPDHSTVLDTSHNHEWENKPFIQELSTKFECKVLLDNDAVVAAMGEAVYGSRKDDVEDFLYITWGSGIGGAKVIKNDKGNAQPQKLDWDIYFKQWEELCGGKYIKQRFGKEAQDLVETEWQELFADFQARLVNIVMVLGIKNIVLGGGATDKQKDRLLIMAEALKGQLNLTVSELGDEVGLYGGFALLASQPIRGYSRAIITNAE